LVATSAGTLRPLVANNNWCGEGNSESYRGDEVPSNTKQKSGLVLYLTFGPMSRGRPQPCPQKTNLPYLTVKKNPSRSTGQQKVLAQKFLGAGRGTETK